MASPSTSNFQRLLSFTKLLASHVNRGRHDQALSLFHHMQASLTLPLDAHVFSLVLKSCATTHRAQLGTAIHAHVAKSSFLSNPFVACALVDMYGKCVSIMSARRLFDEIPQRNVVVWNAMISIYVHSDNVSDALRLFEVMDSEPDVSTCNSVIAGLAGLDNGSFKAIGFYRRMQELKLRPDLITLLALLRACIGIAELSLIKEIHGYAVRNEMHSHPQLSSGLVEVYGRSGCVLNAHKVFMIMKERDVVAWSSLISAYALNVDSWIDLFSRSPPSHEVVHGVDSLGFGLAGGGDWSSELESCEDWLVKEYTVEYSRNFDKKPILVSGAEQGCLQILVSGTI
ncbi:hypothetical protein FEM48_Zijuj04G0075600 [Ziziphus jujuba var. spinosa]|uniref:Pentatricopeptide repeat-containing protein n=1 Tax=Ziziphus jujuba var. spinosa TaxID=714518 RepID=A0A978VIL7_ZIZJJ|nr:hypothetical protein FEM48_Zijuj04G0075600 [Ziziphus jujuba var. spinosa]